MAGQPEYGYSSSEQTCAHAYLLPAVTSILKAELPAGSRLFDLGCGNGSAANALSGVGYLVCGVDPSASGIEQANRSYPGLKLEVGSGYENLRERFGTFPAVVSLEVVEHVYSPREFIDTACRLLDPGGLLVLSTPYHGYLKNLALAVTGGMDAHFSPLWDHGHIKFWSEHTLGTLLAEAGLVDTCFVRAGRIPALAKSMIAVTRKPGVS